MSGQSSVRSLGTVCSACVWLVFCAGLLIGSQAISFARWNEFQRTRDVINLHASLLSITAVGLFSAALALRSLQRTILELQARINQLTPPPPTP